MNDDLRNIGFSLSFDRAGILTGANRYFPQHYALGQETYYEQISFYPTVSSASCYNEASKQVMQRTS